MYNHFALTFEVLYRRYIGITEKNYVQCYARIAFALAYRYPSKTRKKSAFHLIFGPASNAADLFCLSMFPEMTRLVQQKITKGLQIKGRSSDSLGQEKELIRRIN